MATDSKVDTDGDSGNDDEGDDANEDLVLGLHSLLLFERHGCYDVINGDGKLSEGKLLLLLYYSGCSCRYAIVDVDCRR